MRKILNRLNSVDLYLNIDKYEFEMKSIKYFRFIIDEEQIRINL